MKKTTLAITILVGTLAGIPPQALAGTLWLGNDTVGDVFQTSTTGTVITDLVGLPVTGIASDGASLYFADTVGNFTKRAASGSTILDRFFVSPGGGVGEDLAWDSKRNVLWRIVHNNLLEEINPATHNLVNSFNIPTSDPILGTLGGLGIAYDNTRDQLYVSFCSVGCSSLLAGLVDIVNPNTGAVSGPLFRTTEFATGGLGYDPATDTLWVGDLTTVRDMSLAGAVLSGFTRPSPGGFVDGLEFVAAAAVPEPDSIVLFGSAIALLGLVNVFRGRKLRQRAPAAV
jgi:hypothetical protein